MVRIAPRGRGSRGVCRGTLHALLTGACREVYFYWLSLHAADLVARHTCEVRIRWGGLRRPAGSALGSVGLCMHALRVACANHACRAPLYHVGLARVQGKGTEVRGMRRIRWQHIRTCHALQLLHLYHVRFVGYPLHLLHVH